MPDATCTSESKPRRLAHGPVVPQGSDGPREVRVALGEVVGAQPEALERCGTVADQNDVGSGEQRIAPRPVSEVEDHGALSRPGLEMLGGKFGGAWRIDSEDLGAECGKCPPASEPADHP
jgi:hypothetical protein